MGRLKNEFRIEVIGAKELRKLATQVGKAAKKDIAYVNKEAALIIADHAKTATTPVARGDLQKSIKPAATPTKAIVRAGTSKKTVDYAGVIHFGDPKRNIKPDMYLSDAVHDEWRSVYSFYERAIQDLADSMASRVGSSGSGTTTNGGGGMNLVF